MKDGSAKKNSRMSVNACKNSKNKESAGDKPTASRKRSDTKRKKKKLVKSGKSTSTGKNSRPEVGKQSLKEQIVSDVLKIFKVNKVTRLPTKRILAALWEDPKKPWATYSLRGNRMGAMHLSSLLKDHGIASRNIRFKRRVLKGYRKKWFIATQRRLKAIKSLSRCSG